jgi:hypothetical protein
MRKRLYTAQSKATQRKAKVNKKPNTPTRGAKQAETILAEGWARSRIGVRPEAGVATYASDRHRAPQALFRETVR